MRAWFSAPALSEAKHAALLDSAHALVSDCIVGLETELCFYVEMSGELSDVERKRLQWLLSHKAPASDTTSIVAEPKTSCVVEVGPRLSFSTAWCTNAVAVAHACGLSMVRRIEHSRRYLLKFAADEVPPTPVQLHAFADLVHDKMTEMVYDAPLTSFDPGAFATPDAADAAPLTTTTPAAVRVIRVIEEGPAALARLSDEMGLGFDEWDLDFYTDMFAKQLKRNPTDVECFDVAQSNSEHSRHWFFSGRMVLDGEPMELTLFQLVKQTLKLGIGTTGAAADEQPTTAPQLPTPAGGLANDNSVIAFYDNSSSIRGAEVTVLVPSGSPAAPAEDGVGCEPGLTGLAPSPLVEVVRTRHPILTAETHNFPTGVAPFPGAETGTGGRLRDVQATGVGALVGAGISAYCVGNLLVPGYSEEHCPWENRPPQAQASTDGAAGADAPEPFAYPKNLASPLQIIVEASNGASDYGNKFGEPVIAGFARSFGQRMPPAVPQEGAEATAGERREFLKPIMFSAGIGHLDSAHAKKGTPEKDMWVVKLGGPAYRIGMGGGAASSRVQSGGDDDHGAKLDFDAVQRGDAEMENNMNRVVRACCESLDGNPIVSIHDQGAGGNGNVLKEICEPAGARLDMRALPIGDESMSALELWGAEYQENNSLLLRGANEEDDRAAQRFLDLCARERCPAALLGRVTGDGKVVFFDSHKDASPADGSEEARAQAVPVDVPLELVLGDMPQKTFTDSKSAPLQLQPLRLPLPAPVTAPGSHAGKEVVGTGKIASAAEAVDAASGAMSALAAAAAPRSSSAAARAEALVNDPTLDAAAASATVSECLDRVLRLLSVGSKRFLTTKVDRSVSGLIAQQQCVGPLHTPLANVGIVAQSHLPSADGSPPTGIATAVGEQPIKGLLSPAAMARLAVAEALTNLVWAPITALGDVKCSANWMWAAKLPGEAVKMYEACVAMRNVMLELGVAVDGGKDSLSMAAQAPDVVPGEPDEVVKAPGQLVITYYALCTNVNLAVTPDLKLGRTGGDLIFLDLGEGNCRLGGSALAQVYGQIGEHVPDLDHPARLAVVFGVVQELILAQQISAGHDRSDGGLLTALLEMAFAGNAGIDVNIGLDLSSMGVEMDTLSTEGCRLTYAILATLFNEEIGLVFEVKPENTPSVLAAFDAVGLRSHCHVIGTSTNASPEDGRPRARVAVGGTTVLDESVDSLRDVWEATSFALDRRQANSACVEKEAASMRGRSLDGPAWKLSFAPKPTRDVILMAPQRPRVAIIRQEGSNGDREMAAAFHSAGFETWDMAMSDMVPGASTDGTPGSPRVSSLDGFHGIAFVGGFSFADVLGSARGWAATSLFDDRVFAMFEAFRTRKETFSLGVCNGCQLMALLGWVADVTRDGAAAARRDRAAEPAVAFRTNTSGRFESRFSSVRIEDGPASKCMLRGMAGTTLGVWVAHGEGRVEFTDPDQRDAAMDASLAPMRYALDNNDIAGSEDYPFNPNGSEDGVAALCSLDGRHLAMMPHPERCFLPWQWPWMPAAWRDSLEAAPWLRLFQNARAFVDTHVAANV